VSPISLFYFLSPSIWRSTYIFELKSTFLFIVTLCFFSLGCDSFGSTVCIPQCPLQQYCGWCVTGDTCSPMSRCNSFTDLWLSQCFCNNEKYIYLWFFCFVFVIMIDSLIRLFLFIWF
jgi:hypothetical protein